MPLSSTDRAQIRQFLGYPAAQAWNNVYLESALDRTSNDADACTLAQGMLSTLATVENEMGGLHGFAVMGQAEELKLNPERYNDLRSAGRREAAKLASLIGVDVYKDVFAAGSSGGPLKLG